MKGQFHIAIVGGGAAGFFAAIRCAELNPAAKVSVFERGGDFLEKVRISGGGRCNVCPSEFDPRSLINYYPRGGKALLGPFNTFCSGDTVGWFESRGVALKTEDDGRMFPVTDDSETIVQCLREAAKNAGVHYKASANVRSFTPVDGKWEIAFPSGSNIIADRILLAPGSSRPVWNQLEALGHSIVPPVPSLFTFNIKDPRIKELMGLSVPAAIVQIKAAGLESAGPLLITHWGMSGPAILKLSAWGARILNEKGYNFELEVNWLGTGNIEQAIAWLQVEKQQQARKKVFGKNPFSLPNRLWNELCKASHINPNVNWADLSKIQVSALANELCAGKFEVKGKSTFKDEFVTAGGVVLKEVNFKTMESKLLPGLFFAGEVLNIDALTGGYNFQAAWTTGWIAGTSMAESF